MRRLLHSISGIATLEWALLAVAVALPCATLFPLVCQGLQGQFAWAVSLLSAPQ